MIKNLKSLFLSLAISTLIYGGSVMAEAKDMIHMTLKDGVVKIETRPDLAPKHVAQIKQLISEIKPAGFYTVDWDASLHPTGMYFIHFSSYDISETMKVVLIK